MIFIVLTNCFYASCIQFILYCALDCKVLKKFYEGFKVMFSFNLLTLVLIYKFMIMFMNSNLFMIIMMFNALLDKRNNSLHLTTIN